MEGDWCPDDEEDSEWNREDKARKEWAYHETQPWQGHPTDDSSDILYHLHPLLLQ